MNLLAIDTSTDACSCALRVVDDKGERTLARHLVEPKAHSRLLPGLVGDLIDEAGTDLRTLDAVAFGRGPGSFTGLRIACAVAQGIGFGAGCPLVAVSTLRTLAVGAHRATGAERVLVALDARMGEIYFGAFECRQGTMEAVSNEVVASAQEVELPARGTWIGVGSGWERYGEVLRERIDAPVIDDDSSHSHRLPEAVDMLDLAKHEFADGNVLEPSVAAPVYLRNNVATASPRRIPLA
ncbi:tRNA (adenosine(37)-N6)-threonylcarbamoyltransferase complex dimerization subunit type 1 TsaB [Thioalkalivibrio sp. HK1]|uniref:tRNA (adenosine(37)-N6)-threonylcarbamoyltransferase complex dimerization subunit type 1 TsaB n=1 Tax=Thioalkalivibrio sp. HK1 TaxID=1469245 RepID=UPI0004726F83|nr:tRNA (adenosine(37)-N6)-threonylcarbamoyltransferase complex dimerization subunit type 1 TsaB [Thioalkalivibrio sp. HK1]